MWSRVRALSGIMLAIGLPLAAFEVLGTGGGFDLAHPVAWLGSVSAETAITELARLVALALAAYLLVTTLLYLLAVVTGSRRLIRLTRPLALPAVRKLADRLVAGTLVLGTLTAPMLASAPRSSMATAEATPRRSPVVVDAYVPPHMRLKASDPAPTVAFEGRPVTPPPAPPDDPAVEEAADPRSTVVVRRGDNLWDISATRLERRWGRKPADHEIAPYWRRVMETNRPRLRSGDPNLIYPGEVVELPPLD